MKSLIESMARMYKGDAYSLDSSVPLSALIAMLVRRAICALRAMVHGFGLTLSPKRFVFFGANCKVRNPSLVAIGAGSTLGDSVFIDGLSKLGVNVGVGVNIGPYSRIEATGVITNLGEGCFIGDRSGIGAFSFIGAAGGVRIGCDVIMGQRVSFHSENHNFEDLNLPIRLQGVTREGIDIGSDCWIGANVVFLDGARLGSGCVVAAGAVVRGAFPDFSVIAGVPAKIIRNRRG